MVTMVTVTMKMAMIDRNISDICELEKVSANNSIFMQFQSIKICLLHKNSYTWEGGADEDGSVGVNDQVIIITCNGREEDADEDGPGGVDVDDDQVPLVPPAEVPLSLILVV